MDNVRELLDDSEARRRLARHVAGGEPAGLLRSLKIKLISSCNLRCGMCRYWRIPKQFLPRELVFRVLDSAAELGCRKVHLSGGEVTLYKELPAVIRHATSLGLRVNLTSNGVLLDKERVRAWLDAGLHATSFSLDGARAETHDASRGVAGAFERTIKGIRILRRESDRRGMRLRIRINNVLQHKNWREMPDLIRLTAELGALDVVPMPVDGVSVDRLTRADMEAYNAEVAPLVYKLRQRFGMSLDAGHVYPFGRTETELTHSAAGRYARGYYEKHLCYAPYLHTFVGHTGHVYACCMTSERMTPLGNVYEHSLADIFRSPVYEEFRLSMSRQRMNVCAQCDQFLEENRLVHDRLGHVPRPGPVPARATMYALPVVGA